MSSHLVPGVRSFAALGAAAMLTMVFAADGVGADAGQTTSLPVDFSVWVPCAADGAGEMVSLEGVLHVTVTTTQRSASQWSTITSFNPQGVIGTGVVTGDTYRGTGHTGTIVISTSTGLRSTQTNDFRVIGPGPGNNLLAHTTWHLTTLADGSVLSQVDHVSLECR